MVSRAILLEELSEEGSNGTPRGRELRLVRKPDTQNLSELFYLMTTLCLNDMHINDSDRRNQNQRAQRCSTQSHRVQPRSRRTTNQTVEAKVCVNAFPFTLSQEGRVLVSIPFGRSEPQRWRRHESHSTFERASEEQRRVEHRAKHR